MKKFAFLFIAIFAMLSSCSNDDDSSNHGNIVGKWAYHTFTTNNGTPIPYDDHETCGKDYLEFRSDNTFQEIDVWDCELDVIDFGTYTKNNNILTVVSDGYTYTAEIVELTNSRLKLKMEDDDNGDGIDDVIVVAFDRI